MKPFLLSTIFGFNNRQQIKKMKTQKLFLAVFTIALLFTSCDKNTVDPNVDDRDQYIGSWTCFEKGTFSGQSTYVVNISKVGDLDSISIRNFYQLSNAFSAIALVSSNSVTIPQQTISGIKVNGFGIFSSNKINLTYYCIDGSDKDTVQAVLSK